MFVFFITLIFTSSGCFDRFDESMQTYEYTSTVMIVDQLLSQGDYYGVIDESSAYFDEYEVTQDTFELLLYRGHAYLYLMKDSFAIDEFEAAVPFILQLDNVEQREFSGVFFTLGILHASLGNADHAIQRYTYGLQLEPSSNYYQIILGEIYENLGQNDSALGHYRELEDVLSLNAEEHAILQLKIDKLSGSESTINVGLPESYDPEFSIKIIPINDFQTNVSLSDIALLLQSKFRVQCSVLPALQIPEYEILNTVRDQYDASLIINYLEQHLNNSERLNCFPIAVTDYDMFHGTSNYVFSIQDYDADMGVISTYMFEITAPEIRESSIFLGRRVGIQFISTVGQLFGSPRPTHATCPLAYPHSINDFALKTSILCSSTQEDVDERMQRYTTRLVPFNTDQLEAMATVYETYYFE